MGDHMGLPSLAAPDLQPAHDVCQPEETEAKSCG
jgi:hypothetical protein